MSNPGIIILAAGGSTRMGQPKQLLPYRQVPLLRHAVQTALETSFRPVLVVLGAEQEKCKSILERLPVILVPNSSWQRGIGSSIREGVAALESVPTVSAALLMLHDQPLITAAMLTSLDEQMKAHEARIAASFYEGSPGVPALFHRSLFSELKGLGDGEGAKQIILRHADQTTAVPMPEAGSDVDCMDDYLKIREIDAIAAGESHSRPFPL